VSISCDCSCDIDEGPDFYHESFPKARKVRKCCECNGEILPGSKYHKVTGKWHGKIRTYNTCTPCHSIRKHYCFYGFYFGELSEQIMECIGFDYTEVPDEEDDD